MKQTFPFLLCLLLFANCKSHSKKEAAKQVSKLTIAFGSCSDQDKEQILWDDIIAEQPDLWIWLGDNIYGDTTDMTVMKQKYDQQKANPNYRKLRQTCPIIGTWDDHDYGLNDGGKGYPAKAASQQVFLDFLDVAKNDPRRKQAGVYNSYTMNMQGIKIKVLLLDARYFRDTTIRQDRKSPYEPNLEGTVLGDVQWQWLEKELHQSDADVHIFASGIQVIPEEHRFEKWANFPNERQRLFDLMVQQKVNNPVFISGDRHIGEISAIDWKGSTLYDITSSGLTHSWSSRGEEANKHRQGKLVYDENYGILKITKDESLQVEALLKTEKGVAESQVLAKE